MTIRAKRHALLLALVSTVAAPGPLHAAHDAVTVPVRPDDYTVLMAAEASLAHGMAQPDEETLREDGVTLASPSDGMTWTVRVARDGAYDVGILFDHEAGAQVTLSVDTEGARTQLLSYFRDLPPRFNGQRAFASAPLHLTRGVHLIHLAVAQPLPPTFRIRLWSVELILAETRARLHRTALAARANTGWFRRSGFGIMVHWLPASWPRMGEPLSYETAVDRFDIDAFADQMHRAGAGFVLFTTAHSRQYFPAPLVSLDAILPGRTTRRDLIGELADALGRRGIRLMLYYNLVGARGDAAWGAASGMTASDNRRIFDTWTKIVGEVGARYGDRLAGFNFDDGMAQYYPRNAPWEHLYHTAKTGNPDRLVGWNRARKAIPTEFQDYDECERCLDPGANGWLPIGGDGHYTGGPTAGLQAAAILLGEGDWLHRPLAGTGVARYAEIGPLSWSVPELRRYLDDFAARGNVPIFNLEIYQEGIVSERSIAVFEQARRLTAPTITLSKP